MFCEDGVFGVRVYSSDLCTVQCKKKYGRQKKDKETFRLYREKTFKG